MWDNKHCMLVIWEHCKEVLSMKCSDCAITTAHSQWCNILGSLVRYNPSCMILAAKHTPAPISNVNNHKHYMALKRTCKLALQPLPRSCNRPTHTRSNVAAIVHAAIAWAALEHKGKANYHRYCPLHIKNPKPSVVSVCDGCVDVHMHFNMWQCAQLVAKGMANFGVAIKHGEVSLSTHMVD